MSYQQSTVKCAECEYEMNIAFGVVGTTQIAFPPKECFKCKSKDIRHLSFGWNAKNDEEKLSPIKDKKD